MTSNTSLYGSSATTGNVGSNNFTTLYSGAGVNLRPTQPYGNANVERFLNAGTDGANSVTNIVNSGTITSGGNITAPYFLGNIIGNISGNIVVPGSNTDVLFNNNGNAGASDALQFNFSSNVLTANGNINANYFNGNGVGLSHLTGANVSGQVAYAAVANSVAVANVAGIGNIAVVNLNGNGSQVLLGNGTWGAGSGGNAVNANYANYAGNAFSVTGSNVVGDVAGANHANVSNSANSVAGANVTGTVANATYATNSGHATVADSANSVAVANVSGIGNIAVINLDGNVSNLLAGNGTWVPVPNTASSNFANYAGNVTVSSQPNITSVGSLANLTVVGNILAGNANLGNLAIANFFSGDGGLLSNITGANVTGTVANAAYATNSGHATVSDSANSVAVGNVVGIGNIATINLDGNVSNILHGNGFWGPELSNGNANYANFAGTLINGNSNVAIQANANVFFTVAGNANVMNVDGNGTIRITPTGGGYNPAIAINSYGRSGNQGAQRLSWNRYRGNSTTPLSVQPGDNLSEILGVGYNGASQYTAATVNFKSVVDASYVANATIIPAGWQLQVANSTGSQLTHNFYANGETSFIGKVTATAFSGDGGNLSNITGANVTGQVSYAAVANSVAIANVVGIGNIATINLDGNGANVLHGNGVFAPEASNGNANYANFAGNLINGNSNIAFASANGNILVTPGGNANVVNFQSTGVTRFTPPAAVNSALLIDTPGTASGDSHRITSQRSRGTTASPLSVQGSDKTMRFFTYGHNGTAYQTNSVASIQAVVDSTYTANTANIPIGWQITVNDTNGGVNNQSKTHAFYSNGSVFLANALTVSGNLSVNGNAVTISNTGGGAQSTTINGDKTVNSGLNLFDNQFSVTLSNVDISTGFSPFRFQQYSSLTNQCAPWFIYRSRGTGYSNTAPVIANDQIFQFNFLVNSNNVTTSAGQFGSTVNLNDNAGNVGTTLTFDATGTGTAGTAAGLIQLSAANTNVTGNLIVGNNASIGNITLGKFQETTYSIGTTGGTLTPDFNNGSIQTVTLNSDLTLNSLGNAIIGRSMTLIVIQNGTGGHTLTSSMLFADGFKTLSPGAGAKNIISVLYDGSTYYATLTTGYA